MSGEESEQKNVLPRFLRLKARCPACGTSPALRVSERAAHDAAKHDPSEPLASYQCQRRKCGTVYVLHARAYQTALLTIA